jgi:twitching motility protein PilJ
VAAQNIARNTQVLREISAQTADSTHATAQAIIKMADLAGELRKSIAGFRLPAASSATAATSTRPTMSASASMPTDATASQARLKKLGGV